MKRTVSLLLSLMMALALAVPSLAADLQKVEPFEGEAPTLSVGFDQLSFDESTGTWPTEHFQKLQEELNIELEFVGFPDKQQLQIALAGNDLPDVMQFTKDYLVQVLEAGMIIPMDDYLDLAPNMVNLSKLREAAMREYCSNGDGKWYFWTPQIGPESPEAYLWNGYTVRWDWYKELGAPEIKNEDDYIAYLKSAVEAHPETENGQKVWGYATYNDLWGWWVPGSFYGYHNITDAYHLRTKDSALINAYVDLEGPIWEQVEFCFKLNQEGLFDPDSFTMTADDLKAKIANEQYAAIICQWYDSLYDLKRMEDPETLAGYVVLPMEGQGNWSGANFKAGWSFYYGITTNCEDPTVAMKFFDYLNSEEGARFINTGEQGKIWDYNEEGVPVILDQATENKNTMSADEWAVWGGALWNGMSGLGGHTILSDGGKANLWNDRDMMIKNLRPLDKDFAEFYGVELPYEAEYKHVEEGTSWDKSTAMADLVGLLGTPPTEISRIDNNCREIILRSLPDLVLAEDQTAYEETQQRVLNELDEAGIQESIAWWNEAAEPIAAFIEANS